jgi:phosphoglycolate phosphatase
VFNLVVFDLDGTLLDTAAEIALALNAALAERGLPATDESTVRGWLGHGARELLTRAYRRAGGEGEPDAKMLQSFEWHYAVHSGRRSRPRPQALESLRALRSLGVATAVVTNKETRFAAAVLHAHDLWGFLDAVVCGDMVQQGKPDPLGIEHCLERFRTNARCALLAGDSEVDRATARNAGVAVCTSIEAAARAIEQSRSL